MTENYTLSLFLFFSLFFSIAHLLLVLCGVFFLSSCHIGTNFVSLSFSSVAGGPKKVEDEEEPEAPEPFEWTDE